MAGRDKRVLILGGTGEARELAALLDREPGISTVSSQAGITSQPEPVAGSVRSGGFGGIEGLAAYLAAEGIDLVADATHPFAAAISANAAEACRRATLPYVRLERPGWTPREGDDWRTVASVADAAAALEAGARALVTVGRQEIAPFFARTDTHIVARMIEPPDGPVPEHVDVVLARPPFSIEEETALFEARGITVLVAKNSGGEATRAKLDAARALGLPVILVARPAKPKAACAATAEELARMVMSRL